MTYQQRRQQTQNLLKPLPYQNKSGAEHQINQLLHQIHSLNPTVDNYVYNNGAEAQLFKLYGTVPIVYRGTQYNIPVAFWFPLNFPQNPPICYVKPVQGMKVKSKHKHVDSQGLIYHPYLHGWAKNSNHSLVDLIGILCSTFGKDPPLYSQRNAQPQSSQPQINHNHNPNPHQPQSSQPYPNHYGGGGMGGGGMGGGGMGGGGMGGSGMGGGINNGIHKIDNGSVNSANNNINNSNNNNNNNNDSNDLRTRVEDKLRVELQIVYDTENNKLNSLANKRKQLEERKTSIDNIKDEMEKENALLVTRTSDLEKKIKSLETWLSENEDNNEIDVASIILPCDTWSQQCMKAVAEDVAHTDVMLELDKALEDEVLTLDQYMKQIRKLAREQFMSRALARAVYDKQNSEVQRNNPALAAQVPQQRRTYFASN